MHEVLNFPIVAIASESFFEIAITMLSAILSTANIIQMQPNLEQILDKEAYPSKHSFFANPDTQNQYTTANTMLDTLQVLSCELHDAYT